MSIAPLDDSLTASRTVRPVAWLLTGVAGGLLGAAWVVAAAAQGFGRDVPPAALLEPGDPALAVLHVLRLVATVLAGFGALAALAAAVAWVQARRA